MVLTRAPYRDRACAKRFQATAWCLRNAADRASLLRILSHETVNRIPLVLVLRPIERPRRTKCFVNERTYRNADGLREHLEPGEHRHTAVCAEESVSGSAGLALISE